MKEKRIDFSLETKMPKVDDDNKYFNRLIENFTNDLLVKKSVTFMTCKLSADHLKKLDGASNNKLESIQIMGVKRNNHIGQEELELITKFLAKSTDIKGLEMSRIYIGAPGAGLVVGILPNFTNLSELNLKENDIGDDGAISIAEILPQMLQLSNLNLEDNKIGNSGTKALAEALSISKSFPIQENDNIESKIDLRNNRIDDEGALDLAAALQKVTGLQSLDLSTNFIKNNGAIALVNALTESDLKNLYLQNNAIYKNDYNEIYCILIKGADYEVNFFSDYNLSYTKNHSYIKIEDNNTDNRKLLFIEVRNDILFNARCKALEEVREEKTKLEKQCADLRKELESVQSLLALGDGEPSISLSGEETNNNNME